MMAVAVREIEKVRFVNAGSAKRHRSRNRLLLAILAASVCISGPMAYVGLYAKITQNGYQKAVLSRKLKLAKTENQYIRAENRMLSSPDRLAAVAAECGMVPSEEVQYVRVRSSVAVAKAEAGD